MGKAEDNKRKKLNALLGSSYRLFVEQGISKTTIAQIARSAGVGKGTFYFYFHDKQELIDRLIIHKSENLLLRAMKKVRKCMSKHTDMTLEDKFICMVDEIADALSEDSKLTSFLAKNLDAGFYVRAASDDNLLGAVDIEKEYYKIFGRDTDQWKDRGLMLYSVIEFVGATLHTIIVYDRPCTLETYRPYMHDCIRAIVGAFRVK